MSQANGDGGAGDGAIDYEALGFKAGLEIHQQLDTAKLFCRCPTSLDEETSAGSDPSEDAGPRSEAGRSADVEFLRRLRPTQSELGEVDRAALEQARRNLAFHYLGSEAAACLVEMDEEPPHPVNPDAVDVALQVALLLDMEPVDEVHIMRKLVIDGSNTTGFQRTSLLAMGGRLETSQGDVGMQTLCLEEDAARRGEEGDGTHTFHLDRLGIPLVELATDPDLKGPAHVREAAEAIGMTLRATGRVKRGLGTIRQDVNVSIAEGARVELKGVQDLGLIPDAVEWEVRRQLKLLHVAERLTERGVDGDAVATSPVVDVSGAFEATDANILRGALKRGDKVLAVALPGYGGLLGSKADGGPRLGSELAGHAKARAGVRGIFQSDELPAYGITADEVDAVRDALGLGGGDDAFALVAAPEAQGRHALEAVRDRAARALDGVPEETRAVLDDGASRYLRPLPGRARMYPETDVPPFRVDAAYVADLRTRLPELLHEREARMLEAYDLSDEEARVLVRSGRADLFERLAEETGLEREAATTLVTTLPTIVREGAPEARLTDARILDVFQALAGGAFAKEAIPEVLARAATEDVPAAEAVEALGLAAAGEDEVARVVEEVLDEKADLVEARGMGAMGALMGVLMGRFRGNAPGELVSRVLKEKLQERTG